MNAAAIGTNIAEQRTLAHFFDAATTAMVAEDEQVIGAIVADVAKTAPIRDATLQQLEIGNHSLTEAMSLISDKNRVRQADWPAFVAAIEAARQPLANAREGARRITKVFDQHATVFHTPMHALDWQLTSLLGDGTSNVTDTRSPHILDELIASQGRTWIRGDVKLAHELTLPEFTERELGNARENLSVGLTSIEDLDTAAQVAKQRLLHEAFGADPAAAPDVGLVLRHATPHLNVEAAQLPPHERARMARATDDLLARAFPEQDEFTNVELGSQEVVDQLADTRAAGYGVAQLAPELAPRVAELESLVLNSSEHGAERASWFPWMDGNSERWSGEFPDDPAYELVRVLRERVRAIPEYDLERSGSALMRSSEATPEPTIEEIARRHFDELLDPS